MWIQVLLLKKIMPPINLNRSTRRELAGLTILLFFTLILILESLARLPISRQIFPYRSVGNYHYQFELKWFRLQDYVEQNGGVDIIFVGSSLVNTGVDPDVIAKAYQAKTGVQARIFNFGVEGLTVSPNSKIIAILVEKYHPALIVYITEMRDYVTGNGMETETNFMADSWLRYKLREFNPLGWLINNSAFLQIYLPYRNWMRPDFPETMSVYVKRFNAMSASGYESDNNVGENNANYSDPNSPDNSLSSQQYVNYQIDTDRLNKLIDILNVSKSNLNPTSTLVVEMPINPTFYYYVGGDQVHRKFQKVISTIVESNKGFFLPSETCLGTIPSQGRSNLWHLNTLGALNFSNCLGEQLAILAHQQNTYFIKEIDFIREVP